ncbi:hypothetical protein KZZ52_31740 [Dactylosporangium sp. AC04546]|nr:hypothetical protein [Dactylosporangium sp. AC04546]WVK78564.1 hypothetical protein KZZ52_31740 [Dactylosporangium sp. AC04546]
MQRWVNVAGTDFMEGLVARSVSRRRATAAGRERLREQRWWRPA